MKKKNLKRLMLHKQAISKFNGTKLTGGSTGITYPGNDHSYLISGCPPPPPPQPSQGCDPDQTRTCASWNVACIPPL